MLLYLHQIKTCFHSDFEIIESNETLIPQLAEEEKPMLSTDLSENIIRQCYVTLVKLPEDDKSEKLKKGTSNVKNDELIKK